jgi:hypothetical protein
MLLIIQTGKLLPEFARIKYAIRRFTGDKSYRIQKNIALSI